MKNELTPEEATAYRAELAEKWDDNDTIQPEAEIHEEVQPEEEESIIDPLEEKLAGITEKLSVLDRIDYRLKQAENRIGSVQQSINTQMQAAKDATKHVANAPDKDELAAAAKSDEAWKQLKEDYPEWSEVMDGIEKRLAGKQQPVPDVSAIRQELQTDFDQKLTKQQKAFEVRLVGFAHKDWKEKSTTPEFDNWLLAQDYATRQKALSENADDVIDLLDKYDAFMAPQKQTETPEEIDRKRKERLKRSTTTKTTGRAAQTKSEQDMSPEEYRAHLANQMWPD